jgi:hypothetical protein
VRGLDLITAQLRPAMSVAMLQAPSRASTSSSSSFVPVSRQNTYLSMSAKEKDLEIEDDLAKGMHARRRRRRCLFVLTDLPRSPEDPSRAEGQDLLPVKEELRP